MSEKKNTEMKHGVDVLVRDAIQRLISGEKGEPVEATTSSLPAENKKPRRTRSQKNISPSETKDAGAQPQSANKPKRRPPKKAASGEEKTEQKSNTSAGETAKKQKAPANKKKQKPAETKGQEKTTSAKKSPNRQGAQANQKNTTGVEKASGGKKTAPPAKSGRAAAKAKSKKTMPAPVEQPPTIFGSNRLASATQKQSVIVKREKNTSHNLRIIPLGGLGEVGKNMTLIEYKDDIVVVDAGLSFPDDAMPGIDLVIPDYSYLLKNSDKVRAFLLTHGHEDHIGALPFVLKDVQAPVYGSPLTLGLLKGKLTEQKVNADLRPVSPRETVDVSSFKVEFIRLTHSIPDAMGLAIHTPVGTILFISDFKMDMSPIDGKLMDFSRITALGERGVLLLMSDSTNAERDGFTASERSVGANLERFFNQAEGRIIVTSFASHVHRAQQVLWAARRAGRKVAVVGRGMQNMFAIAAEMGYLDIPSGLVIDISEIDQYPANKVVVITTGSQGEPLSGLTRMASGEHRHVQIRPGDTVIISATPIPGNERTVGKTVDNLLRLGANVIHERNLGIHVSGHASREELKLLINMVKPHFFLPVHGEYRMLHKHALLAQSLGMPAENTPVIENGQILEVNRRHCRVSGSVPSGRVLVDGFGVGDVGSSVLKERRQLSESGVIVISLVYTKRQEAKVLLGPEIYSRGFIFEKEYEHIISEMKNKVAALCTPERLADGSLHDLQNQVRSGISRFVLERTGRRPVIMAVVSEV